MALPTYQEWQRGKAITPVKEIETRPRKIPTYQEWQRGVRFEPPPPEPPRRSLFEAVKPYAKGLLASQVAPALAQLYVTKQIPSLARQTFGGEESAFGLARRTLVGGLGFAGTVPTAAPIAAVTKKTPSEVLLRSAQRAVGFLGQPQFVNRNGTVSLHFKNQDPFEQSARQVFANETLPVSVRYAAVTGIGIIQQLTDLLFLQAGAGFAGGAARKIGAGFGTQNILVSRGIIRDALTGKREAPAFVQEYVSSLSAKKKAAIAGRKVVRVPIRAPQSIIRGIRARFGKQPVLRNPEEILPAPGVREIAAPPTPRTPLRLPAPPPAPTAAFREAVPPVPTPAPAPPGITPAARAGLTAIERIAPPAAPIAERAPFVSPPPAPTPRPAINLENVKIADEKKFFVFNPSKDAYVPIVGKRIEIVPDLDTLVHPSITGWGFQVTEGKSGLLIASASTRKNAIGNATKKLVDRGDEIPAAIQEAVDEHGLSPRYKAVVPEAAKPPTAPGEISEADKARLREAGISESAIQKARRKPLVETFPARPAEAVVERPVPVAPEAPKLAPEPLRRPIVSKEPMRTLGWSKARFEMETRSAKESPPDVFESRLQPSEAERVQIRQAYGSVRGLYDYLRGVPAREAPPAAAPVQPPTERPTTEIALPTAAAMRGARGKVETGIGPLTPERFAREVHRRFPEFKKNPTLTMGDKGFDVPVKAGQEAHLAPQALGFSKPPPKGTKMTMRFGKRDRLEAIEVQEPGESPVRISMEDASAYRTLGKRLGGQKRLRRTVAGLDYTPTERAVINKFLENISGPMWNLVRLQRKEVFERAPEDVLGATYERIGTSFVSVYMRAIRQQALGKGYVGADAVTIHEFWHALSKFVPKEEMAVIRASYKTAFDSWRKGLTPNELAAFKEAQPLYTRNQKIPPELLDRLPEGSIRYVNEDEWFATHLTKRAFEDIPHMGNRSFWQGVRELLLRIAQEIKRSFSRLLKKEDVLERVYGNFRNGKYVEPQDDFKNIRSVAFARDLRPGPRAKVSLDTLDAPASELLAQDFSRERTAFASGWKKEFGSQVIVERVGSRFRVVEGEDIIAGLRRRRAKGLSVPQEIEVTMRRRQVVSEALDDKSTISVDELRQAGFTELQIADVEKVFEAANRRAAIFSTTPGLAEKELGDITGARALIRVLGTETGAKFLQSPHLFFPELYKPVYLGEIKRDHMIRVWSQNVENFYKNNKLRPGSRLDKQLWDYRQGLADKSQVDPRIPELSSRFTKEITDPLHKIAVENDVLLPEHYRPQYAPAKEIDAFEKDYFDDTSLSLGFDAWMAKKRTTAKVPKGVTLARAMHVYIQRLANVIHFGPRLQAAEKLVPIMYENDGVKAAETLRWLKNTRNPYAVEGSVTRQKLIKAWRLINTLWTQTISTVLLGWFTQLKNYLWGTSMTIGHSGKYALAAKKFILTARGRKILAEYAPDLLDEAIPTILGTYSSPLEGVVKFITRIQRLSPIIQLQMRVERILRTDAFAAGWLEGEAMGLTGDDLLLHARFNVVQTQQIFSPIDMPRAFRGPFGRPTGQFIMIQLKQLNEALTMAHTGKWSKFSRYAAAALLLFYLAQETVPRRRLFTRGGKEYDSGGVRWYEGVDLANLYRAYRYAGGDIGMAVPLALEETFVSPPTKTYLHGFGVRLPSDRIFSRDILAEDLYGQREGTIFKRNRLLEKDLTLIPMLAGWKNIQLIMETQGHWPPDDNSAKYINAALGLEARLEEAKTEREKAILKDKYWYLAPLRSYAKTADKELRSLSSQHSKEKTAAKEDKAKLQKARVKYEFNRTKTIRDFNARVQQLFRSGGPKQGASAAVENIGGAVASVTTLPTAKALSPKVQEAERAARNTPLGRDEKFSSPRMETLSRRIAVLEGFPVGGSLAQRQNNPGNLKFDHQPGSSRGELGFAKFTSAELGWIALKKQILLDASRGLTLEEFVHKFAPPHENATREYLASLAQALNANARQPLTSIL